MENKVNLFVVGAPKSGTSSIYQLFRKLPEIFAPNQKEMHFFSQPDVLNTYYNLERSPRSLTSYHKHFDFSSDRKYFCDCSPSYLHSADTAGKIFEYNAKAKIIIVLRNPVDRAISHYLMDRRYGLVEHDLLQILQNPNTFSMYYDQYVANGFYARDVKPYQTLFPAENILILRYDELINTPKIALLELENFLKIDNISQAILPSSNQYHEVRFDLYKIYNRHKALRILAKIFPKKLLRSFYQKNFMIAKDKPAFIAEQEFLQKIFDQDIET